MCNILYVVIPCYNEEEVLLETARQMKIKMTDLISSETIDKDSHVVFVNDGSTDKTWELITALHEEDSLFSAINLSRNRGHQNALLAGLMTVRLEADMVISMDADLQDDISAMDEMIDKYNKGINIVYGVRNKRESDTFFKKVTAEGFYRIMNAMGINIVFNHADYRLLSKRALEGLSQFKEANLFLRGIVPLIGFSSDVVYYERKVRYAGKSKYPIRKMLSFAIEGITSFSIQPLRMITHLGFIIFLVSIAMLIYSIVRHFLNKTIVGWTTLMVSVWAIGGLILLALGIVGEYIGKIYMETKERPRYFIENYLHDNKCDENV